MRDPRLRSTPAVGSRTRSTRLAFAQAYARRCYAVADRGPPRDLRRPHHPTAGHTGRSRDRRAGVPAVARKRHWSSSTSSRTPTRPNGRSSRPPSTVIAPDPHRRSKQAITPSAGQTFSAISTPRTTQIIERRCSPTGAATMPWSAGSRLSWVVCNSAITNHPCIRWPPLMKSPDCTASADRRGCDCGPCRQLTTSLPGQ